MEPPDPDQGLPQPAAAHHAREARKERRQVRAALHVGPQGRAAGGGRGPALAHRRRAQ